MARRHQEEDAPDPRDQEIERLRAENTTLQKQLANAPTPEGPPKGTAIHFRRPDEAVCRPGVVTSDGFVETVKTPRGVRLFAVIEYGDQLGAPARVAMVGGKEQEVAHAFQTNRPYSSSGEPDTWHLEDECHLAGAEPSQRVVQPPEAP